MRLLVDYCMTDKFSENRVKYAVNRETGDAVAIKVLEKAKIVEAGMQEQIKKEVRIIPKILCCPDFSPWSRLL